MEAAIGNQKLAPHPKILPLIWACPNRGNDFQPRKLSTKPGNEFRLQASKPTMKIHFDTAFVSGYQFCYLVGKPPWKAGGKRSPSLSSCIPVTPRGRLSAGVFSLLGCADSNAGLTLAHDQICSALRDRVRSTACGPREAATNDPMSSNKQLHLKSRSLALDVVNRPCDRETASYFDIYLYRQSFMNVQISLIAR